MALRRYELLRAHETLGDLLAFLTEQFGFEMRHAFIFLVLDVGVQVVH